MLLAYYEGYSRDELAARFGKPVNTIKTWLHRSLTLPESVSGTDVMNGGPRNSGGGICARHAARR